MIDDGTCNWALVVFLKGTASLQVLTMTVTAKKPRIT